MAAWMFGAIKEVKNTTGEKSQRAIVVTT